LVISSKKMDNKTFQQISPYQYRVASRKVPIIFHLQSSLFPNEEALEQLQAVAETPGVFHHVAVLSDVHPKKGRKCPTGVAVASEKFLPQVMDTAPNCGMRMISLSLKHSEVSQVQIDSIFKNLVKEVPTQAFRGEKIDHQTVLDICRFGSEGVIKNKGKELSFLPNELEHSLGRGNEFSPAEIPKKKDLEAVIPKIFLRMAKYRLGILGMAGNHFLDLMKVENILDGENASRIGLEKDQLVFFMHTGSGILGQYLSYFYTPKEEEHLLTKIILNLGRLGMPKKFLTGKEIKKLRKDSLSYRAKKEFFTLDPNSRVGEAYYLSHRASGNFGYANRAVLSAKIRKVVEKELNKKINWSLIYDMPHIGVRKENHYGKDVWVHRNGVSRAFGPKRMSDHPIFSQTGEPCFFAGSMTTPSYLALATDDNVSTFFSASHGAGKKKDAPRDFSKEELFKKLNKDGVRLYNAKSRGVVKQYSDYYKNINEVMEGIKENKIARPVARLAPIAVLMA